MGYLETIFLGLGLATDASCVCASNGLVYKPGRYKTFKMALVYAVFQSIMPIIGFMGASLLPQSIYQFSHIITCVLLCAIGIKMVVDAYKDSHEVREVCPEQREEALSNKLIVTQGIATSIDALGVGFAFSGMRFLQVVNAAVIIGIVTFIMCISFVKIGIFIGDNINAKTELMGGIVLILLGVNTLMG